MQELGGVQALECEFNLSSGLEVNEYRGCSPSRSVSSISRNSSANSVDSYSFPYQEHPSATETVLAIKVS